MSSNKGIAAIILLFVLANMAFLWFYSDIWWDASVYIGMGRYIFSGGESGLWEESRPLVLPFLLGTGWLLNFELVYFGRILSVVFSVLTVFVTYKIGLEMFSKRTALLATFFLAFSYNFIFFSPNILTEIPSTLFVLLAFYFFLKNRFFLMGLFSGVAVMTRLFQAFTLLGLFIAFLFENYKKPLFYKKIFYAGLGILVFTLPYFFLNIYLYNDIMLPFKVQAHLAKTTGWTHFREFWFYISGLLKENFFFVFLFAIPFYIRKNHKFYALLLMPLIYLAVFSLVKHKEMRFMISILPFLYLLISHSLAEIHRKTRHKKLTTSLFFILLAAWLSITFINFKDIFSYAYQKDDEGLAYFQNYMKAANGSIWVTSPLYALYSDTHIDGLLYFYSSSNLINFVNENKNKADSILFNNCDIPCPPAELDSLCSKSRKELFETLSGFKRVYQKEEGSCTYTIYRKATS